MMGMIAGTIQMNDYKTDREILKKMCSVLHHRKEIKMMESSHAVLASEQMESIEIEGKKVTVNNEFITVNISDKYFYSFGHKLLLILPNNLDPVQELKQLTNSKSE